MKEGTTETAAPITAEQLIEAASAFALPVREIANVMVDSLRPILTMTATAHKQGMSKAVLETVVKMINARLDLVDDNLEAALDVAIKESGLDQALLS